MTKQRELGDSDVKNIKLEEDKKIGKECFNVEQIFSF